MTNKGEPNYRNDFCPSKRIGIIMATTDIASFQYRDVARLWSDFTPVFSGFSSVVTAQGFSRIFQ